MSAYLIIGNIFSLLSAICIAISVAQKSKKKFMLWQIGDTAFGIGVNIALVTYAALVISIICLIRNILSYCGKLTKSITVIFTVLGVIIGFLVNNLGFIGWFPIVASASYTIFIYTTKNEQQMRYASILNMVLWLVHNAYVGAYPSAIANVILCGWTIWQIWQYHKNINKKSKDI